MELEAKETRMVILGLKKLLNEVQSRPQGLSDEDDEYVFLANDAALLEVMISRFEDEYQIRYGKRGS